MLRLLAALAAPALPLLLAACAAYQAPPVEHPALPGSFRNAGPWATRPVATLPPRAAEPDRVILLPEEGGKVGKVAVSTGGAEQVIGKAYAALAVDDKGGVSEQQESEESVRRKHGAMLDARPKAPVSFLLFFKPGGKDPTEESLAMLQRIKAEVDSRPVPELLVIGHTDSVGKDERNQVLSVQRAELVVGLLQQAGVRAKSIEAVGRGETDPLVPGKDETPEPRNRRTEVLVR